MGSSKDPRKRDFAVMERQGWREKELAEADSLEDLVEQLKEKTGDKS